MINFNMHTKYVVHIFDRILPVIHRDSQIVI